MINKIIHIGKLTLILNIFLLVGCQQNDIIENFQDESSISDLVEKIETSYETGMSKIENIWKEGDIKEESDFPGKFTAKLDIPSTTQRKATFEDYVGVIKGQGQSCGSYSELEIYMDCEDSSNKNSSWGWIGAIDNSASGGNALLRFCLVPKRLFSSSKHGDYAVLSFSTDKKNTIDRYFDNEDSNNKNRVYLNGRQLNRVNGRFFSEITLNGSFAQDTNTWMSFLVYRQDKTNGANEFPNLGFSYGVMGTLPGFDQGGIYTDEEDKNNTNNCHFESIQVNETDALAMTFRSILVPNRENAGKGDNKGTTFLFSKVR